MSRYLWLVGVFVASLVGAMIGALPIAALALLISLLVILPLTLGVAGMFAALCAAWAGNLLAPGRARRRLVPIVGITEATAAVLAVLLLALVFWLEGEGVLVPTIFLPLFVGSVVVLALVATVVTWRSHDLEPNPSGDVLLTLGLLGLTGLAIVWGVALAFFLGQVGF